MKRVLEGERSHVATVQGFEYVASGYALAHKLGEVFREPFLCKYKLLLCLTCIWVFAPIVLVDARLQPVICAAIQLNNRVHFLLGKHARTHYCVRDLVDYVEGVGVPLG